MRVNRQALGLSQMMRNQKKATSFDIALPLMQMKSSVWDNISIGDIIKLGVDDVAFVLVYDYEPLAKLAVKEDNIVFSNVMLKSKDLIDTKKYKIIKASLCQMDIPEQIEEMNLPLEYIDFSRITLSCVDETIAEGSLVRVDDVLAIKVKELVNAG